MISEATFSSCRKYRYDLRRVWDPMKKLCVFILLNPSTADEVKNDPTVARCLRRAELMGYGGVRVLNIFAWRATNPRKLYSVENPVGPNNNGAIIHMLGSRSTGIVICGWGQHGLLHDRGIEVMRLVRTYRRVPHVLGLNANGTPEHPLYLSYRIKPVPWPEVRA